MFDEVKEFLPVMYNAVDVKLKNYNGNHTPKSKSKERKAKRRFKKKFNKK